jgi:arylsulfatase A-like enzyme
MDRAPNILWICTDQQRFDTLGCHGNSFVRTPHIDALATQGTLFEKAYSQSPVCTPSRASFLTGRYPRTTRARQNGQDIPADERLISRILADHGYACGLSGKLHLSACHPTAAPLMERRIDDGYINFHWSHHPARHAASNNWAANEYDVWLRQRGSQYTTTPFEGSRHVQIGMPEVLHQTTWCSDKAIEFMQANADYDHPWMFSVNIFDPHHAFDPPMAYLQPYLDRLDEIPLPNYVRGELENKPRIQTIDHEGAYGGRAGFEYDQMSERDHRLVRAAYWAMCDLIDLQVGRMLAALDETSQRGNTIVIFMSDHGEMLGDHGIYLKGSYFYEEAVHVPLMMAGPGIAAGRRVGEMVELADIVPTLLDLCGISREPGIQGRSFSAALHGEAIEGRTDIYSEYYNAMPWHPPTVNPQATMVRTDTMKMVAVHGEEDEGELYDLINDPTESHNLWFDPSYSTEKLKMYRRLCDRMAWTADPLPLRRAEF